MVFEFEPTPDFNFVASFAQKFQLPVQGDILNIPHQMGEGYIRHIDLSPAFKLIIHRYQLKEDFIMRRKKSSIPFDLVSIIFNSNEEPTSLRTPKDQIQFSRTNEYAIQIASSDLDSEIHFKANCEVYFTVIGIQAPALKRFLHLSEPTGVVATILNDLQGYVFYESMTPDVQKNLRELIDNDPDDPLRSFYYQIKVQQLFYFLFANLIKRESIPHTPITKEDAEKLFLLRNIVLSDLSKPPSLPHLAKMIGMSETKMKDLFKQVFGDSIYNHYQKARMEEAAFLLKQMGHSVADTGYYLGFTNMSHFSRVFEKYYGIKPKKYSLGG